MTPPGQLPFERPELIPADTDLAVLRGMPHGEDPDDEDLDDLRGQCRSARRRLGRWALSVFLTPPEQLDQVLATRMRRFPYYRSTTVGVLRARYELRPTFDAPHWSVLLDDIGNRSLRSFLAAFGSSRENEHYQQPGKGGQT